MALRHVTKLRIYQLISKGVRNLLAYNRATKEALPDFKRKLSLFSDSFKKGQATLKACLQ